MHSTFRLVLDCPDQIGLVAAVSQFLSSIQASILEASHHTDIHLQRFFMRHEIAADSITLSDEELRIGIQDLAQKYDMKWSLSRSTEKRKVASPPPPVQLAWSTT